MPHISANELKTKGVAAIEAMLADHAEAIVSVRGKDRFVVMDMAHYHHLRECELDAALAQTRADLAAGRFVQESARRMWRGLTSWHDAGRWYLPMPMTGAPCAG
jgi:PHD/YefM family antitoxin component YafN of YafNO toxin-antitoxin module